MFIGVMSGPVVQVTSVCLVAFCVCDRCNLLSSQLLNPTVDLRSLLITLTTKGDRGEHGGMRPERQTKGLPLSFPMSVPLIAKVKVLLVYLSFTCNTFSRLPLNKFPIACQV